MTLHRSGHVVAALGLLIGFVAGSEFSTWQVAYTKGLDGGGFGGHPTSVWASAIASDPHEDFFYVAGFTNGPLDPSYPFDPEWYNYTNSSEPNRTYAGVVMKFHNNGERHWSKLIEVRDDDDVTRYLKYFSIVVDSNQNIYVAGITNSKLVGYESFWESVPADGNDIGVVTKIDSDGNLIWHAFTAVKKPGGVWTSTIAYRADTEKIVIGGSIQFAAGEDDVITGAYSAKGAANHTFEEVPDVGTALTRPFIHEIFASNGHADQEPKVFGCDTSATASGSVNQLVATNNRLFGVMTYNSGGAACTAANLWTQVGGSAFTGTTTDGVPNTVAFAFDQSNHRIWNQIYTGGAGKDVYGLTIGVSPDTVKEVVYVAGAAEAGGSIYGATVPGAGSDMAGFVAKIIDGARAWEVMFNTASEDRFVQGIVVTNPGKKFSEGDNVWLAINDDGSANSAWLRRVFADGTLEPVYSIAATGAEEFRIGTLENERNGFNPQHAIAEIELGEIAVIGNLRGGSLDSVNAQEGSAWTSTMILRAYHAPTCECGTAGVDQLGPYSIIEGQVQLATEEQNGGWDCRSTEGQTSQPPYTIYCVCRC